MEKILSVEEVAAVIGLTPFTVRKMFREGRLTGFKIGRAWRIKMSQLEADIERFQTETAAPATLAPSEDAVPEERMEPVVEPGLASGAGVTEDVVGRANILVFSDPPGAEVLLDGQPRGRTTLSIVDVASGHHRLKVGDVQGEIDVPPDHELRVRPEGRRLRVSRRPLRSDGPEWINGTFRVRLENRGSQSGPVTVRVKASGPSPTATVFAATPEVLTGGEAVLSGRVKANAETVLFEDTLRWLPGTRVVVTFPSQLGIEEAIRQEFVLDGGLSIRIALTGAGVLRGKPGVRIRRDR